MTVLVYLLMSVLVACVAHWLLGASNEDSCLAGVAWPAAGCLLVVLGLGVVAVSPVLLGMWIYAQIKQRRGN